MGGEEIRMGFVGCVFGGGGGDERGWREDDPSSLHRAGLDVGWVGKEMGFVSGY